MITLISSEYLFMAFALVSFILDNLSDNGAMNSNNISSLFNENIREKLKNLDFNELLKEIRSSSFLEAYRKYNSILS